MFVRGMVPLLIAAILAGITGCNEGSSDGPSLSEQYQQLLRQPNPDIRANKLVSLAIKQNKAGDTSGLERSLDAAAAACAEIEHRRIQASAYNKLAYAQATLGMVGDTKDSLKRARGAVRQIEDRESKIPELAKMARIHAVHLQNTTIAIAYMNEAEGLVDGIDDPAGKVTSLTAIAFYYHKMQMADEVTQVLESAGQIAREAEDPRQRANSVARIAMTLNRIQRVDESVAMFDESLKLASQIPTEESKAYALVDIARQLGDAGRSSSAREALLLAEELANGLSDRSQQKPLMDKIRLIHSRLRSIRVNASP